MIGKLTGIIDSIEDDQVLIDVNGVGYIAFCPATTLSRLQIGERTSLLIEMQVSEDAIKLYGFSTTEERAWYRLLRSVQGVGAKVALAILAALKPAELQRAITLGDKAMVARAQGVGPKLALRVVNELKDKAPKMLAGLGISTDIAPIPASGGKGAKAAKPTAAADAMAALTKLGYSEGAANEAIALAIGRVGEDAPSGELIRECLKGMDFG